MKELKRTIEQYYLNLTGGEINKDELEYIEGELLNSLYIHELIEGLVLQIQYTKEQSDNGRENVE